jgi:SagB-type dehydrogenase family enzyme
MKVENIKLPEPHKTGGKGIMDCLNERHTTRQYSSEKIDEQTLSNLLWAAWGINREDGKRTAPSAKNMQEMKVYVAMESGLYLYCAEKNELINIFDKDIRKDTGFQDFVAVAPLNLIYTADANSMMEFADAPDKIIKYSCMDAAFIAQNVYLFCASEGLDTVARGAFDPETVAGAMFLPENEFVVLTQTVGKND